MTGTESTERSEGLVGLSRRRFLTVGGGVAAGAALTACGGGKSADEAAGGGDAASSNEFTGSYTGPAVTLAYWNGFTGGDGPFMDQLVEQFQMENRKITIKQNTLEWADFYQKVPAAVNAGKGPDVGVMHLDQLATNAVRNVVVPVDDVADSLGLAESDFSSEVWKAGIYQDKRYGIPLDVHSLAMYWRTDVAEEAGATETPTDAASFDATLQQLQESGFAEPFWMPSKWPSHLMFLSLLWQNGGEPYSADGSKATFDSEQGVAALSWQVDQIKKGYSPKNVAIDTQYLAFKNGKVAVTWDGIWQINDLKAAKTPFGIAAVPTIGQQDAVWANSHNFFVTRQATQDDNKYDAARVFIDWMSKKSAEWAGAAMIPARNSVRESADVQSTTQAPVAEQISAMRFLPAVPGLGQVQTETLELAVNEATLLKKSPADALTDAAAQATSLMEANLSKFGG